MVCVYFLLHASLMRGSLSLVELLLLILEPLPLDLSPFLCLSSMHHLLLCAQKGHLSHVVRRIVLSSVEVSNLAGLQVGGNLGCTDGVGTNAKFNSPAGIALDAAGTFAVVVRRERV